MKPTRQYLLVLCCTLYMVIAFNFSFFSKLTQSFPITEGNLPFIIAVGILLFSLSALLLSLLASHYSTQFILIFCVLIGAITSHFTNSFGTIIDTDMLNNLLQTDLSEAQGLMSVNFALYVVILGLIPSYIILKVPLPKQPVLKEAASKITLCTMLTIITAGNIYLFSGQYASLFREYKPIRYLATPIYPIYSGVKLFIEKTHQIKKGPIKPVSTDAKIVKKSNNIKPNLVIMVVGESARADHFQLNGYNRPTNPLLSKEPNLVNFTHVMSCGTATAVSVPCMFSIETRKNYHNGDIYREQNALDVLGRLGVHILWRDNNSSSKGVADRFTVQPYKNNPPNTICTPECRDAGMLVGLQNYINHENTQNKNANKDIFIVLHMMGNHGPEYYKRYPKSFEKFAPVCKTNQLGKCTKKSIINAYDNAILYTDYFLKKVIDLLKHNKEQFNTHLLYISDHGESLGENGIYLHGMPYALSPESQRHVPAIYWQGDPVSPRLNKIKHNHNKPYSQDNVYCTLFSLFDVTTKDCPIGSSMLQP